jgi:hypothetical protein
MPLVSLSVSNDKAFIESRNEFSADILSLSSQFPSSDESFQFCNTCSRNIKAGKKPKFSITNGLDFPNLPECLKGLTPLEERLISPRLPFMVIKSLGVGRQNAIKGAVVNVPIPVSNIVTSLPRAFHEAEVVQLHLRRRMEYSHNFMAETIRPMKISDAIRFLVDSELYKKHNVVLNEQWMSNFDSDTVPFIASQADAELVNNMAQEFRSPLHPNEDIEIEELNPGGQETLLDNNHVANVAMQRIIIAPGEGQRPLDMILDADSEELAFPTIYAGVKRKTCQTFTTIVRSELRNFDRRGCRTDKLFFNYKKLELLKIRNNTSICLRKHSSSRAITASNALNEDQIDSLIRHDDAYRVLKGIRTSPAHWEAEKKKVMAMIRQFGLPTFFITLSAAESRWGELLVILKRVVDKEEVTEEEALGLASNEKVRLIRTDPVTCVRYFDNRWRQLFKIMKKEGGVFGRHNVVLYYWRVEFQQRGSPHIHGMFWLKDAPKVDFENESSIPPVIEFIDQFVTTDVTNEELAPLIEYQKHKHGRSCQRELGGNSYCRFGIPFFPMPRTEILKPLPEGTDNYSLHRENLKKIQSVLNFTFDSETISHLSIFDNFLSHTQVNLTYEEYIYALRSGLKKPQIFLKRCFNAICTNAYNKHILGMQRANIDIQFILDPYACCSYIINYINKSQRGISKLMRDAVDEIHNRNFTVRQKLQYIGNKFISGTEISAQEAVYCCLGIRLSEASNGEAYINTSLPQHRVKMLKPRQQLVNMAPDSTDIFVVGLIEHYVQHPNSLNGICLGDFAANYTFSKSTRATRQDSDNEDFDVNEVIDGAPLPLLDGSGFVRERTKPKIIRFRSFNTSTYKHFRSLFRSRTYVRIHTHKHFSVSHLCIHTYVHTSFRNF